ncbi:Alginate lyase 2 domain protein [Rhodopirellula maiorica SM1]|uniref:Alginate lyase 2 domain protein n=1 Tax=Rhodopirellula maiorica SM1 TaxID=1265738 RepID=M5RJV1_9BACT|nr:Alginate lyase 2 domain protein [Rhodopirellula maiorica SM1]
MRVVPTDDHGDIDLNCWKLTLPVDASGSTDGKATEIPVTKLVSGYNDSYFKKNANGSVTFWCPVTGAKTEGTEYPRSELREMLDPGDPSVNWTAQGTHILDAECRISKIPSSSKVIIGQIHSYTGKAKPLVKLQYFKNRIEALVKVSPTAGKDKKLTFPNIEFNTAISYQFQLNDGLLTITVNGESQSQDIIDSNSGWGDETFYFKAGVYVQDNEGDESEGAQATFSKLAVTHNAKR